MIIDKDASEQFINYQISIFNYFRGCFLKTSSSIYLIERLLQSSVLTTTVPAIKS